MIKDASADDVEIVSSPGPADGTHEVLFPVGMPDEGIFAWADQYLEANPTFTEISNRKIVEWAAKSGIQRQQPNKASADSPDMNFGIPLLDDLSVRKLLSTIAPTMKRNFLVMELKANLIPEERQATLARFGAFKKVGVVAMGEPSAEYKGKVYEALLADKMVKAEEAKKKKAKEQERKRLLEEKKRRAEEAKKAKLEKEKKAKEARGEEVTEEAVAEVAPAEEKKDEEEKKEEDTKMDELEPVVELTDEDKKMWHIKKATPDLSQAIITKHYASFKLPEVAEGFDDVRYAWQPAATCTDILQAWIHEKKMTQRVEDLEPGVVQREMGQIHQSSCGLEEEADRVERSSQEEGTRGQEKRGREEKTCGGHRGW
jgi:hypothetical protein